MAPCRSAGLAIGVIYITNNATGGTFARLEMADAIERPPALRIVRQMHMSLPKLVCENIEFVNVRSLLKQIAGLHLRH